MDTRSRKATAPSDDGSTPSDQELKAMLHKLKTKEEALVRQSKELEETRHKHEEKVRSFEEFSQLTEKELADQKRRIEKDNEVQTLGTGIVEEIEHLREEINKINNTARRASRGYASSTPAVSEHSDTTPKVTFREATEAVPHFDGYNLSLSQFTRACRRAREIVPSSSERNLTKLLVNKLRGRAYSAIEDEPCESVTQLIDLLTAAFGSPKTIDQYRGELSTVFLGPKEHILDYITRVKDLRTAILDAERRENGYVTERITMEIDELTARSFCDGLPLEYRLQMDRSLHSTPSEAFARAKAIAKRQELDKLRYNANDRPGPRPNRPASRPDTYPIVRDADRPRVYIPPPRARYQDVNQERNQATWRRDRSRTDSPQNREDRPTRFGARTPSSSREQPERKTCRYCKNIGHDISECRKREYNNALRATRAGNETGPENRTGERRQGAQIPPTRPARAVNLIDTDIQENEITESH